MGLLRQLKQAASFRNAVWGAGAGRFIVGLLHLLKQAASFRNVVWGAGAGRFAAGLLRQLKQAASAAHGTGGFLRGVKRRGILFGRWLVECRFGPQDVVIILGKSV